MAAAGLGTALAVVLVPSAGAAQAPKAVVSASMTAASHQSSVHITGISTLDGQVETLVADAAAKSGQQEVVIHEGKTVGHVTGRLAGGSVYLRGDEAGLTGYLGMPATTAPKYANKWIVFGPSSTSFSQISERVHAERGGRRHLPRRPPVDGRSLDRRPTPALVVKGTTGSGQKGSPAQLYVATGSNPLPVRFVVHDPSGKGKNYGQLDFSRWGEKFSVARPGQTPFPRQRSAAEDSRAEPGSGASDTVTSISTAPPRGRLATPRAERVWRPASPKT